MSEVEDLRAAIAQMETQRPALGDTVVDAAVAGLTQKLAQLGGDESAHAEGERKQVTVLFADLSGFTTLSEVIDAEDARNLVNAFFQRAGQVVLRYGGYIDKFIGDELMALFGAPIALEDHASRALHAALEIVEDLESFNAESSLLREHRLAIHLGVNSGLVVTGGIGAREKRQYTAMGDAVNVAARLVGKAKAGEVLIGQATHHLTAARFEFAELGVMELKGRAQGEAVYQLLRAAPEPTGIRSFRSQSMVGRELELGALVKAFEEAHSSRQPRSVTVIGPAGIGKSRIQQEFRSWLESSHPATKVLRGFALPYMTTTPYFSVAVLLRQLLAIADSDSTAEIERKLDVSLGHLGITDRTSGDALALLLALEREDSALTDMSPHEKRDAISAGFTDLVRALAASAPVVLVFEDLHWADDLSLDLLEQTYAGLSGCQVMFLTLTRPIADASAKSRQVEARIPQGMDTRVVLRELDDKSSRQLVRSLAPALGSSDDVADEIVRKGEGNPFFIEEIIGTLSDRGMLQRAQDSGSVAVADLVIPDTVWGVLAERIDRLPQDQKHVLQNAAVVGRVFWTGAVSELAEAEAEEQLEALSEREMVQEHGTATFGDDLEWIFRHVLVQEVAYSGLLKETRKSAHLRVARWLEQRMGDRQGEHSSLLAHHYELGEEWDKAAAWAEVAADRAASLFAHAEAKGYYLRSLSALRYLEPTTNTKRAFVDVALKLGRAGTYTPTPDVLKALEEAEKAAADLGDKEKQLRVQAGKSLWLYMTGQGQQAVMVAMQCIAGGAEYEQVLVGPYGMVARAMGMLGDWQRCADMMERSIEIANRYGIDSAERPPLGFLGLALMQLGEVQRGLQVSREGLRLAEASRDLRQIAAAHNFIGACAVSVNFTDGMLGHLEKSIQMSEEAGDQALLYTTIGSLGHYYALQGDFGKAEETLNKALKISSELGSSLFVPVHHAYRADVQLRTGRAALAVTSARTGAEMGVATRQEASEAEARRALAWALHYSDQGSEEEAEQELRKAVDMFRRIRGRVLGTQALFELAHYLRLMGRPEESVGPDEEATAIAREFNLYWLPISFPAPPSAKENQP